MQVWQTACWICCSAHALKLMAIAAACSCKSVPRNFHACGGWPEDRFSLCVQGWLHLVADVDLINIIWTLCQVDNDKHFLIVVCFLGGVNLKLWPLWRFWLSVRYSVLAPMIPHGSFGKCMLERWRVKVRLLAWEHMNIFRRPWSSLSSHLYAKKLQLWWRYTLCKPCHQGPFRKPQFTIVKWH